MSFRAKQATSPHFDISKVLRPSDKISVSIPCRIRIEGSKFHQAETGIIYPGSSPTEAAVIVVVPSADSPNVRITHLIPITPEFHHSLYQTPPSPSASFFHQSSKPHITLTLWNGDIKTELRISSSLTVKVQAVMKELRRLTENASTDDATLITAYSWMNLYPTEPPAPKDGGKWDDDDVVKTDEAEASTSTRSPSSTGSTPSALQTSLSALTVSSEDTSEDGEFPNPYAPTFSRTGFLRKRLFARQEKWSQRRDIRIRLATYNVNDKLPPPGTTELVPMVGDGEEDLLVFAFQEADLRSQALLISQGNVRADEWEAAIRKSLKDKAADYEKIAMTQYVGVVTMVFVKRDLREHVSRVETSERGIGLLGFGGNKAGVAVRLKVYDSTLCFVNCHLAAFSAALERRRQDYQTLLRGLTFPRPSGEDINPAFEELLSDERDKLMSVEDSHLLFWLGDLNYRVELDDATLRSQVEEKKWKTILEKDQLIADIASEKSFAGFQEGEIDFPPSFKYVHGSSTLDSRRSPAYTDRILYSVPGPRKETSPTPKVRCDRYSSHEVLWSDHRPVSATYTIDVRVADEAKRREEYVGVERELEKLEELYRPSLEITGTSVEFGEIKLLQQEVREVKLVNNGKVPVSFSFRSPSPNKPFCKPYYWLVPSSGVIESGKELLLKITLSVDAPLAKRLTLGEDDLNDVLVLQVADGKDTFLTLQATFLPTILTLSLDYLSLTSSPIRSIPLAERKKLWAPKPDDPYESQKGQKPVKEVWRLLEFLMSSAQCPDDLWHAKVGRADIMEILECLDTGMDLPMGKDKQVAKTLIVLLGSLPDSLVGAKAQQCERVKSRDEAYAALEGLAQANTNILIGLMSVVRLCAGIGPTLDRSGMETPKEDGADANSTEANQPEKDAASGTDDQSEDSDAEEADLVVYSAEDGESEDKVKKASDLEPQVSAPKEAIEKEVELPVIEPRVAALPKHNEQEEVKVVSDITVEALVPAVFGFGRGDVAARKRFIRCMLDG